MCCRNIHLTGNPFTFKKYKLFFMTFTCYQNKMLYKKVFFSTKFTNFIEDFEHTQKPSKDY